MFYSNIIFLLDKRVSNNKYCSFLWMSDSDNGQTLGLILKKFCTHVLNTKSKWRFINGHNLLNSSKMEVCFKYLKTLCLDWLIYINTNECWYIFICLIYSLKLLNRLASGSLQNDQHFSEKVYCS